MPGELDHTHKHNHTFNSDNYTNCLQNGPSCTRFLPKIPAVKRPKQTLTNGIYSLCKRILLFFLKKNIANTGKLALHWITFYVMTISIFVCCLANTI